MPKLPGSHKSKSRPGLGADPSKPGSVQMKRVREAAPKADSDRASDDADIEAPSTDGDVRREAAWGREATTSTHRRKERSVRPPVVIDDVGAAAMKIARTRRPGAPKLVASRGTIAKAPIDTRAAFVLSLVDGRNSVDAIIDMSGMVEDEAKGILARLARLGLIELP